MPAINDLITLNPDYGSGVFKRYIRLTTASPNTIIAALSDDCHAFSIHIEHNKRKLVRVIADWERHPTSACAGAVNAIKEAEGFQLCADVFFLRQHLAPRHQCTHIFDLLSLAIVHAYHQRPDYLYKIEVDDENDGVSDIRVFSNEQLVCDATVNAVKFISPEFMMGAPVKRGFSSWVKQTLSAEQCEVALMMQMAYFVAIARRFDLNAASNYSVKNSSPPVGSCYALQEQRIEDSIRLPSQRTLGDNTDEIFRFCDK